MSHCPSCGRYVGPHDACPHCGARLVGRISIHVVKIAAILLATVGLAVLWFVATRAEVPLIQIGQAGATMNMAYVRVQGRCTRAPSYDPESGYLSLWIEDDTGEAYVSAYRAETQQIIEQSRVPALGDQVEVAGTLRIREDFLSLTVNIPEQLKVTRAEPVDRDIGTITPQDQYLRVRVRGQVRQIAEPYQGLTLITVRDATGSVPIALTDDLIAISTVTPAVRLSPSTLNTQGEAAHSEALTTGQSIEVVAAVSLYGDTVQLVPASVADIVPLSQPVDIGVKKQIGELTAAHVGQLVVVRGTVTQVDPFSSGVKITLDDTTGAITLLLWQSVYDAMHSAMEPEIGAEVQVQGEVARYQGELEVVPELAEDVQVLVAATSPPDHTDISTLTAADVGRWVTLRGTLDPPDPFSAGVKFTLDDGTGQIVLLLWSDVYEHAPDGLGAGAQVVVTGEVAEYQGELELIPRNADRILVLSAGEAPTPPPIPEVEDFGDLSRAARPIDDVTSADLGTTLLLKGTLSEPEIFSKGIKFRLDDTTGTIILLLWQDIYDAIPDADSLVAGARVEVIGWIDEYQGDLEIIPEPDGVRVLE